MTFTNPPASARIRNVRLAVAVAAILAFGDAVAQCTYAGDPWPATISFTPAAPAAGESLKMQLDPFCNCTLSTAVSVSGSDVVVTGNFNDYSNVTFDPPPHVYPFALTPLPAGDYRIHLQLTQNGAACPEVVTPLTVGG